MTAAPRPESLGEERDLLRFLACGSVDDGKSTLIGRLLLDTGSVPQDTLEAARRDSARPGTPEGFLDLALLVDGLAAEREQGITIDVAWRPFATARRRFLIADTPGHEQYTRNMATGASHCDLALLLVDVEKGVVEQTRRHAFVASLLGVRHLVVAVNKMDRVGWAEGPFQATRDAFAAFATRLPVVDLHVVPVSALEGDNVATASPRMPWYRGAPVLDLLETVHIASDRNLIDLRLPIQLVIRPPGGGRVVAGSVASGILRPGEEVVVLPSRRRTRVAAVETAEGPLEAAAPPTPVVVRFAEEIDVGRGDLVAPVGNVPRLAHEIEAMVVWMSDAPLAPGRRYLVKHTTAWATARVDAVRYRIDVGTLHRRPAAELGLNDIGRVHLVTATPLAVDPYDRNRATGSFILVDPEDFGTLGAGLVLDRDTAEPARGSTEGPPRPGLVVLSASCPQAIVDRLRSEIHRRGVAAIVVDATDPRLGTSAETLAGLVDYLRDQGLGVVVRGGSAAALSSAPIEEVEGLGAEAAATRVLDRLG